MRWRNLNRLALCQGELALARGDATAALAYTRDALAQAQTSAAQKYICQAHDLAGRAEMALGKFTEALASLEKSVAIAEAIGYRAGLWRTLATLSKLYRQLGRLQPARQAHTRAAEALTSILMTVHDPDIVRLLHELPEVQAIVVAGRHARRGYPAGLTEREAQVLRLVAHGQTNHEIAAALVLSERTVNSHLVRIFNKLGVNSRAAAAAFATRHGLDE
jgi:DNA-binding CsgD family transcriptional regulator